MRVALRFEPVRDALVGGEHELFDEAVGPAALRASDGGHVALRVELDDGSGRSKSIEPRRWRFRLRSSARVCIC